MVNHHKEIEIIDQMINQFEIERAKQRLDQIGSDSIAAKDRAAFASLARRCGELKLALKILQPVIFGVGQPTTDELIEYASSMRRLGLINQAKIQLDRISNSSLAHLHKAFCHIHEWNYPEARVELELCIEVSDLSEKQQLVAKVNLLTCLVESGSYQEAHGFLDELEVICQQSSPHLLLNCLETRGQIFVKENKPDQALEVLQKAFQMTEGQESQTQLFIEKWLIIAKVLKGELIDISPEVLDFRKHVRSQGHWETLRDFNWQIAKLTNNQTKIKQIYFGTPFVHFRNMMKRELPDFDWPSHYMMMDSRSADEIDSVFDFYDIRQVPFAYGKNLHRLMMLLCSDSFQPWSVARIFSALFPEDLFDPQSSPKRVYRLLEKLDKEIEKHAIALDLHSTSHGYRLRPKPGCFFKVQRQMVFPTREQFFAEVLRHSNLKTDFGVEEIKNIIPLSEHQWYRALKKMEELGEVERLTSKSAHYRFKKSA